jgi:hypothetical protein
MFDRFFADNAGTLIDRTREWTNPYTDAAAWDAKTYIYSASFFPFNHRYFDISTANDQAGALDVQVWYNNEWKSVADIIDYTKGTNSLEESGNIQFTLDDDFGWEIEGDSSDITELASTKVYNAYWMRFVYDAAAGSALIINYIGLRFCEQSELYIYYPVFNNSALLDAYASGKTDWNDQIASASSLIVKDMKSRNFIQSKDQLLDSDRFKEACIHKTAEIIFSGLGESYADDKIAARKMFRDDMDKGNFVIDANASGTAERDEITGEPSYLRMSR